MLGWREGVWPPSGTSLDVLRAGGHRRGVRTHSRCKSHGDKTAHETTGPREGLSGSARRCHTLLTPREDGTQAAAPGGLGRLGRHVWPPPQQRRRGWPAPSKHHGKDQQTPTHARGRKPTLPSSPNGLTAAAGTENPSHLPGRQRTILCQSHSLRRAPTPCPRMQGHTDASMTDPGPAFLQAVGGGHLSDAGHSHLQRALLRRSPRTAWRCQPSRGPVVTLCSMPHASLAHPKTAGAGLQAAAPPSSVGMAGARTAH